MRAGFLAILAATSVRLCAADSDLPKPQPPGTATGNAALFHNDGGDALFPETKLSDADFLQAAEAPNLDKATADYERAQAREARWQRLWKAGVLAKVEAERAILQTARCRARMEKTRVAAQAAALEDLRTRATAGTASADSVSAAESALQSAQSMSAEADAALRRTELLLAEANVDRQRRLIAAGIGSKTQLQRAESSVAELKRATP